MVLASIQPTILLPVAARNPLVSGRFSQSRLVRPPIVSDRPYLCRTHTMKEPIPSATASLSQSKSDQLISICELENNQRTAQLFPGLVKSPIKIETTIRDTEDGSLLPQMFDGSSQSWSISSLHIPNFTGQSGLCDDHSSGYGSPSPTLSTQMDLRWSVVPVQRGCVTCISLITLENRRVEFFQRVSAKLCKNYPHKSN